MTFAHSSLCRHHVVEHMWHIFILVNLVVAVHAQPPIYTGRQDDRP
jgi:hypothetical protein